MARSLMKGSATLWIGTAVITRTSSESAATDPVSTPRIISAFITVASMPMLSASARPIPHPSDIRPRK